MSDWVKDDSGISIRDIEKRQTYRLETHAFVTRKRMPWPFCSKCGLLLIRNELTEWCKRMGCNSADHPEYHVRLKRAR